MSVNIYSLDDSTHIDYIYNFFDNDIKTCINFGKTCRRFYFVAKENLKYQAIADFILKNYRIVTIYSPFEKLWHVLRSQPVILLGEKHTRDYDCELNGKVINAIWSCIRALLTESKFNPNECQIKYIWGWIGEQSKSWDLKALKYLTEYLQELYINIHLTQSLIVLEEENNIEIFIKIVKNFHEILKQNYPDKDFSDITPPLTLLNTLCTLDLSNDELSLLYMKVYKKKLMLSLQLIICAYLFLLHYQSREKLLKNSKDGLDERNLSLVNKIIKALKKGKVPVALMGSLHAENPLVIRSLKENKIDFISCIPLKKQSKKTSSVVEGNLTDNFKEKTSSGSKTLREKIKDIDISTLDGTNFYKPDAWLFDFLFNETDDLKKREAKLIELHEKVRTIYYQEV